MTKEIESKLVINLIGLQNKIQKRVGGALSVHGIGLSDYLVLNQLYSAPSEKMRRSDLAERVGLSPSGVTRLLNPLQKIGLVEKEANPRDARISLVALTITGKKVYEEARVSFDHASATLLEPLGTERRSTLSELLKIVL